ncbi:hypothetical protein K7X08_012860 [Anisodus acutangulus]|uniref:RNA-dependent RNA polymerase n=1 Tax=Anisodus acutangulus TaxID=402998 RepID=A0A9Q1RDY1_9SOLA|nr:hypothetical protein K7X08_012860 [Anisodus acutangulus]
MESEGSAKDLVLTQISVGGFDNDVNAKMLSEYLEEQFGQVWREGAKNELLRKSGTSYIRSFASSESTKYALAASRRNEILLEEKPLKVSLGPENPFRLNEGRRTIIPCKFPNVSVEIGVLVGKDDFVVGWRGPHTGVNFLVDPFNGTCKILFTKNIVFSLNDETRHAIITCNFKIEFLLRGIDEIKEYKDFTSLEILLQLDSSPLVFYRTADDIEESVAFDLLDNDDQWIRTTDITCSGAIEPFFCFQKHEGLSFKVLFLVNVVLHKGIINQHQMTNEFFSLLRRRQEGVNLAALKHMFVNDAIQKLARIQRWMLKNPNLLERTVELANVVEVRRLVITPTRAYCLSPTVELSNRVLRNYKHVSDRFLRVTFMDKGMQNLNSNVLTYYAATVMREITSNSNHQRTAIFQRVKMEVLPSEIPNLERNGYVFSDGIGMMSADLATKVAEKLQLSVNPPYAYQIRYAGCKGVVACWPAKNDGIFLSLRPSMKKFDSNHTILEICSWTRLQLGFLNRQIVTLLSSLGVKDEKFWEMQKEMLSRLDKANLSKAMFHSSVKPFFGKLFCCPKFSDIKKNLQVIKGLVVIAKNPCLHPGDVRFLEAVDVPSLHHLYDCLVFPQKGDRPHSNEASGSDLDDDLYFVTWDENLIPPSKKSWMPMDYAPAQVKQLGHQVKHTVRSYPTIMIFLAALVHIFLYLVSFSRSV